MKRKRMKEFVFFNYGRGDYAHLWCGQTIQRGEWFGTHNPEEMHTVWALNHQSALNKFIKMYGIKVKWKNVFEVRDHRGREFMVEELEDVKAQLKEVEAD